MELKRSEHILFFFTNISYWHVLNINHHKTPLYGFFGILLLQHQSLANYCFLN